jgi:hypothetical protein
MAMPTRISTGSTVHSTSMVVLCAVLDGTGWRDSRKRIIT